MSKAGADMRIKRWMVRDAIQRAGGMTRVEIEEHFKASRTTVQSHLTAMRAGGDIFIGEWREPATTGSWSPVWMLRTSADQCDAPQPLSKSDKMGEVAVVKKTQGVKSEHARIARARHQEHGIWGGLVPLGAIYSLR